ncbi:MAG: hypothetical protein GXO45_03715 [Aquificae bacterium]|nr:hypothetical protein [Aquificota bacterium]
MLENKKGIALLTALILGFISLSIVATVVYLLINHTKVSSMSYNYTTALEVGKGIANLIINRIENGTLQCGGKSCIPCPRETTDRCKIDIGINQLGDYTVEGYLTGYKGVILGTDNYQIFTVKVISSGKRGEVAQIEFIYQLR